MLQECATWNINGNRLWLHLKNRFWRETGFGLVPHMRLPFFHYSSYLSQKDANCSLRWRHFVTCAVCLLCIWVWAQMAGCQHWYLKKTCMPIGPCHDATGSWPHPYSNLIFDVFPLNQIADVGVNVSIMYLKLFGREIIFEVFQPMWSRYLNLTDGRTHGQTDRQTDILWHNRALHSIARYNKKAELPLKWPRDAPFIWVPWKISRVPEYGHGDYSRKF